MRTKIAALVVAAATAAVLLGGWSRHVNAGQGGSSKVAGWAWDQSMMRGWAWDESADPIGE